MRAFYCDGLGCVEVEKPSELQARGGFWAKAGQLSLHFGVDHGFHPARKAHPAFVISDLSALVARLQSAGHVCDWDTSLPDVRRCFVHDPVGNRIELMAS